MNENLLKFTFSFVCSISKRWRKENFWEYPTQKSYPLLCEEKGEGKKTKLFMGHSFYQFMGYFICHCLLLRDFPLHPTKAIYFIKHCLGPFFAMKHGLWLMLFIRLATLPIPTSWVVTWCSILFLNFLLHLATRETYVGMLQCMIPVIILVSLFVVFKPTYDKVRCFMRNYWQFCLGSN